VYSQRHRDLSHGENCNALPHNFKKPSYRRTLRTIILVVNASHIASVTSSYCTNVHCSRRRSRASSTPRHRRDGFELDDHDVKHVNDIDVGGDHDEFAYDDHDEGHDRSALASF